MVVNIGDISLVGPVALSSITLYFFYLPFQLLICMPCHVMLDNVLDWILTFCDIFSGEIPIQKCSIWCECSDFVWFKMLMGFQECCVIMPIDRCDCPENFMYVITQPQSCVWLHKAQPIKFAYKFVLPSSVLKYLYDMTLYSILHKICTWICLVLVMLSVIKGFMW